MNEIKFEDLDNYVRSYDEDKLLIIVLWTRYCFKCAPFLERVNRAREDFDHLHFVSSEIDDIPLFAPPGTPAMVVYYKGLKVLEHLGDLNEMELENVLRNWYGVLINQLRKHYGNHNYVNHNT